MNSKLKKAAGVLLIMILTGSIISGCNREMTTEKILSKIAKNIENVSSMKNRLQLDIELEDVVVTTKVKMDMELENCTDPKAGHAKGTAQVSMRGTTLGSEMEIYQVMEDGGMVTYSCMDNIWSRETMSDDEKLIMNEGFFQGAGGVLKDFSLAGETVLVDDTECYEMYGEVPGNALMELLGNDIIEAFGMVEIPDADMANLKIPVTIDVYKEEILPARMMVDMTEVMNELYDQYGKTANVNVFRIDLDFNGYDDVQAITVPQEVREAVR